MFKPLIAAVIGLGATVTVAQADPHYPLPFGPGYAPHLEMPLSGYVPSTRAALGNLFTMCRALGETCSELPFAVVYDPYPKTGVVPPRYEYSSDPCEWGNCLIITP